jgi:hypothetical protein
VVSRGQLLMMLLLAFLVDACRFASVLRLVCLSPNYVWKPVRLSINVCTQCARRCSSIFGCALPHEQVHQDTRQHCLVLCGRFNLTRSAGICGNPSDQRRLLHLNYGSICCFFNSNSCTMDLEEGKWVDTRNVLAWCVGECARHF